MGTRMAENEEPRTADEIPEDEAEELIRDLVKAYLRPDLAEKTLAWLDSRLATRH